MKDAKDHTRHTSGESDRLLDCWLDGVLRLLPFPFLGTLSPLGHLGLGGLGQPVSAHGARVACVEPGEKAGLMEDVLPSARHLQ